MANPKNQPRYILFHEQGVFDTSSPEDLTGFKKLANPEHQAIWVLADGFVGGEMHEVFHEWRVVLACMPDEKEGRFRMRHPSAEVRLDWGSPVLMKKWTVEEAV